MLVEVYHESDQVIRYRISGGGRSFEMEKQLKSKRELWKLLKPPPFKSDNIEEAALALLDIQNAIDDMEKELKGEKPDKLEDQPKNWKHNKPE